jgi:dihydroxy-acid dehydratase
LIKEGFVAWQYNTIGVSDGIAQGNEGRPLKNHHPTYWLILIPGMRFSLQSREIIADSIETVTCAQFHDACIAIPGCDKNMPGCVMGIARHNRPSVVIYGGSMQRGFSKLLQKPIDINTCYEAQGAYLFNTLQSWSEDPSHTPDDIMSDIEQNACPGAGSCAGMYTANTLATIIETLGLTLPGSASTPATSPSKMRECEKAAKAIRVCMEKNIRPSDILTSKSFENAIVMTMAIGGSTNSVLHSLAMARTAGVNLTLDDFQRISLKVPFIANLAPSGKYYVTDLYDVGGIPSVMKLLIAGGLLDGSTLTVTGKTLAENVESWPSLPPGQEVIRSLDNPIKKNGHLVVLKGNLAPGGAVAKITGKQGLSFTGKAMVFDKEDELSMALDKRKIPLDVNIVIVVRYEGPKGGPGMPEQLKASAALMGANLTNVAVITDGRYSGASHGFIVGHIVPEAAVGGPISIDAEKRELALPDVSDDEIKERLRSWKPPKPMVTRGCLAKYAFLVGDASHGAMTDLF